MTFKVICGVLWSKDTIIWCFYFDSIFQRIKSFDVTHKNAASSTFTFPWQNSHSTYSICNIFSAHIFPQTYSTRLFPNWQFPSRHFLIWHFPRRLFLIWCIFRCSNFVCLFMCFMCSYVFWRVLCYWHFYS